ncbi:MAG: hypothetical protein KC731_15910 [Myxococcales bacterium]|nr:hypothetical protein [Myxococcales bacterium]
MSHSLRQLFPLAVLACAGASLVAGCPGKLENPERFAGGAGPGECPDIEELFVESCGNSGCHDAATASAGLDLVSAGVASRLTNQLATGAGCGSAPLADPDNPTDSVVYNVLTDDFCSTNQMPWLAEPLTADVLKCVEEYIAGLPPGNPTGGGGMGSGGMGTGGMGMGGAGGM